MRRREVKRGMRPYLLMAFSSLTIFLAGCGTQMVVIPKVGEVGNGRFQIKGKIIYEGSNREYLPRIIVEEPASESVLTFRYAYTVSYGKDNIPQAIPLFNPLTVLGFPIGEDSLVVNGKLEVLRGGHVIKSYTATSAFEKTRSVFWEGETFSELRKKGLIAVRDNIEAQMYHEREFLSRLSVGN